MSNSGSFLGIVEELWRYPVKSMLGERLNETELTERGLLGDRAYALRDKSDGKIATAKNPRKWPNMFDFSATLVGVPSAGQKLPAACITLPDGTTLVTGRADASSMLSAVLKRDVALESIELSEGSAAPNQETSEEYWLDMEGLEHRDTVTDFNLPQGTFFDTGIVHVLTRATLECLQELYPEGRFEVPRFRPNIVVNPTDGSKGFVKNDWQGQIIAIGEHVRLKVDLNCARCVMTTLAQRISPKTRGFCVQPHNITK
jgi:uncharacterized protein